jgi:membrane-bound serine protease (ClpP class)
LSNVLIVRSFFVFVCLLLLPSAVTAQNADTPQRSILVADLTGVIGPGSVSYISKAIQEARRTHAEALILRMDTPGGLMTSMRETVEAVAASPVPVVGYVAPSGAHAASAGTYILYATHVAAMAPGTNIGAATPVRIGTPVPKAPGIDTDASEPAPGTGSKDKSPKTNADALDTKSVNDAVALIRELAQMRGRNADWAEKAVREAVTLGARDALKEHVIEIVAPDMGDLLAQLDGRSVTAAKEVHVLATKGAATKIYVSDFVTQALGALTNPNVALILMLLGIYGLLFELTNPGSVAPGVIGAISIVLALYALHQLPLNYAGLTLVLLGVAFMAAEAFTPSYGVLGIGGIASFVIGAGMLTDTDVPEFQVSPAVIAGLAAFSAGFLILVVGYLWRLRRRPVQTGTEYMVGGEAVVIDWTGRHGHVWTHGERWAARGEGPFVTGQVLKILKVESLTVFVAEQGDTGKA